MHMKETIEKLMVEGKGILAADESIGTAGKRLDSIGLKNTEDNRRRYRELFLNTDGLETYISGVILHEETLTQTVEKGILKKKTFADLLEEKGIVIGIKVDGGLAQDENSEEEFLTKGIDTLSERLKGYYELGARFAKWRAAFKISGELPTDENIKQNADLLARYAKICQEANIVPIIEPEVLMDGDHSSRVDEDVTRTVLLYVFGALVEHEVDLKNVILKANMVLSGKDSDEEIDSGIVAASTMRVFNDVLPNDLGGVVFLSGGQSADDATNNLREIVVEGKGAPWNMTFSYARALQGEAMKKWAGDDNNVEVAREVFVASAKGNCAASVGE